MYFNHFKGVVFLALFAPLSCAAQTNATEQQQIEFVIDGHAPDDLGRALCERVGLNPDHGLGGIGVTTTYATIDDVWQLEIYKYYSPRGIYAVQGAGPPYSAEQVALGICERGGREAVSKYHAAMDRRRALLEKRDEAHLMNDAIAERIKVFVNLLIKDKQVVRVVFTALTVIIGGWWIAKAVYYLWQRVIDRLFATKPPQIVRRTTLGWCASHDYEERELLFNKDTEEELMRELKMDKTAIERGLREFAGLILEGPPGTGKTLFAQQLSLRSGFKIVEIPGARLAQLPLHEALQQLYELDRWLRANASSDWFWTGYPVLV